MNATLLFICGPHCGGKTSILKRLEKDGLICVRGSEIGKDLFYSRNLDTEAQGDAFEREVTQLELERDNQLVKEQSLVAVETWHPGNLAYAAIRNPHMVEELAEFAKQSPFIEQAIGIWLQIPAGKIKERTQTFIDEPEWAADFYTQINAQLSTTLALLNLEQRTETIDASDEFDIVYEKVKEAIQRIHQPV